MSRTDIKIEKDSVYVPEHNYQPRGLLLGLISSAVSGNEQCMNALIKDFGLIETMTIIDAYHTNTLKFFNDRSY